MILIFNNAIVSIKVTDDHFILGQRFREEIVPTTFWIFRRRLNNLIQAIFKCLPYFLKHGISELTQVSFLDFAFCFIARARKDTKKIDRGVKDKAERLHHIACVCIKKTHNSSACSYTLVVPLWLSFLWMLYSYQILKDKAQSKLKKVADKHWSDGALEVLLFSLW